MITVKDIYNFIDSFAPFDTPYETDNVGILVGNSVQTVEKVLLAMDITTAVIKEAHQQGAEMILSHHPVIYRPISTLPSGSSPYLLASYGISALCAHTNLDMSDGGVNASLAERLGLTSLSPLRPYQDTFTMGLVGVLPDSLSPSDFAVHVKTVLGCGRVKLVDGGKPISMVAVCGGGAGDFIYDALKRGADAFVTGDSRHHEHIFAMENSITFVEAGHFHTETVVLEPLREKLQTRFPSVTFTIAKSNLSPVTFI